MRLCRPLPANRAFSAAENALLFSFNAVLFTEVFYHIRFHTSSRVFKLFYKLFHAVRKAAYVLRHAARLIRLRREKLGGRKYQTLE